MKLVIKSNVICDLFFIGVIRDGSECWYMYEYIYILNRLGSLEMFVVGVLCFFWFLLILIIVMIIIMIKVVEK